MGSSFNFFLNSSIYSPTNFHCRHSLHSPKFGQFWIPFACLNVDVSAPDKLDQKGNVGRTKEIIEDEKRFLVGTYDRAPVVLSSGKGCKLYDVEGKEYLDLSSGIAVNALGHGDPDWLQALLEQANTLTHVSNVY